MNELREQIETLVHESARWDSDETADRILALIAEAMLSDKAKIAASRQMHELSMIGVWDNKVFAHEGIQAALVAAGVTANRTGDHR